MEQINYIEPLTYTVFENGILVKENQVPRALLNIILSKQKNTVNRTIVFSKSNIDISISGI
jgi:hypothetical protein